MAHPPSLLLDRLSDAILVRIARMLLTNRASLLAFMSTSPNCRSAVISATNQSFCFSNRTGDDPERSLFDKLSSTLTSIQFKMPDEADFTYRPLGCPLLRTLEVTAPKLFLSFLPHGLRDLRLHLPFSLDRQQFFDALSELTLFSLHLHLLPTPSKTQPPSLLEYPQLSVCLEPAGKGEILAAVCPFLQVLRFFFVLAVPFEPTSRLFPNLRTFSTYGTGQTQFGPIERISLRNSSPRFASLLQDKLVEVHVQQSLTYDQVFALQRCRNLRSLYLTLHSGAEAGMIAAPFLRVLKRLELEWIPIPPHPADTSLENFEDEVRLDADQPRFWSPPGGLIPAIFEETERLEELRLCAMSCDRGDLRRTLKHLGRRLKRLTVEVCGQPESASSRMIALLHFLCRYNHNLEWFEPANIEELRENPVVLGEFHLEADCTIELWHRVFEMVSRRLPFLTLPSELRFNGFLAPNNELLTREPWCEIGFDVDAEDLF